MLQLRMGLLEEAESPKRALWCRELNGCAGVTSAFDLLVPAAGEASPNASAAAGCPISSLWAAFLGSQGGSQKLMFRTALVVFTACKIKDIADAQPAEERQAHCRFDTCLIGGAGRL